MYKKSSLSILIWLHFSFIINVSKVCSFCSFSRFQKNADAVEIKYSFIDVEGYIKREEKGLFVINIVYVKLVRVLTAMDDIIPTYFIAF